MYNRSEYLCNTKHSSRFGSTFEIASRPPRTHHTFPGNFPKVPFPKFPPSLCHPLSGPLVVNIGGGLRGYIIVSW